MNNRTVVHAAMMLSACISFRAAFAQSVPESRPPEAASNSANSSAGLARDEAKAGDTSFLCKFTAGPRADHTDDLAGRTGIAAVPVGSGCSDGTSSGIAVKGPAGEQVPLTWNGALTSRTTNRRTGTICQFLSGPKAHGWHDFAPFPAAPVESTCEDGEDSVGIVQSAGHGDRY